MQIVYIGSNLDHAHYAVFAFPVVMGQHFFLFLSVVVVVFFQYNESWTTLIASSCRA